MRLAVTVTNQSPKEVVNWLFVLVQHRNGILLANGSTEMNTSQRRLSTETTNANIHERVHQQESLLSLTAI